MLLLVGTDKGAFLARTDAARDRFRLEGPHFLGHTVNHAVLDPRDRRTLLVAARSGSLGATVHRSEDFGQHWREAGRPPTFGAAGGQGGGRVADQVFWLTPSTGAEPGVWYAGTSPQGLFRSEDGGRTWDAVKGLNQHPSLERWTAGGRSSPRRQPVLHSIQVDPRDPARLYVALSPGGVFTSDDRGSTWGPLNDGLAADPAPATRPLPVPDPHRVALHPAAPTRLYQQSHGGIYRLDRPTDLWQHIGERMPKAVGDSGFALTLHPRDADTAWVFPMAGGVAWPRVSPQGRPLVCVTRDAGRSWRRLDRGLPRSQAWLTVLRQAFVSDAYDPVGIYFGTTSGEIWASRNQGASFRCALRHLPRILSLDAALLIT